MTPVMELSAFDRVFLDSFQILSEWREWLGANWREATVRGYWHTIQRLLSHAKKSTIHDITEEDLVAHMNRYPANGASRQQVYYAARSLWGFGVRRGKLLVDITAGIPAPRVREKTPDALSQDELHRLVISAGNRHPLRGYTILFLYYTAARLGEACAARWEDVIEENLHLRTTKGGDERVIPINVRLREVLEKLHDFRRDERIIPRKKSTVEVWVADAGKHAGIGRRVYPHLLRATTATTLLGEGVPVHVASRLLGHKSINTTQRYLAVNDPDLRKAVESL